MAARLKAPGWYRAALGLIVGFGVGMGIDVGLRALSGGHPLVDWTPIVTVGLISTPFGFLVGIGCFDYWFRWASGAPTVPEDHSGHGARTWRDYFRVNTDHKVIGIQYICTTFFFFVAGGGQWGPLPPAPAPPRNQLLFPHNIQPLFLALPPPAIV